MRDGRAKRVPFSGRLKEGRKRSVCVCVKKCVLKLSTGQQASVHMCFEKTIFDVNKTNKKRKVLKICFIFGYSLFDKSYRKKTNEKNWTEKVICIFWDVLLSLEIHTQIFAYNARQWFFRFFFSSFSSWLQLACVFALLFSLQEFSMIFIKMKCDILVYDLFVFVRIVNIFAANRMNETERKSSKMNDREIIFMFDLVQFDSNYSTKSFLMQKTW